MVHTGFTLFLKNAVIVILSLLPPDTKEQLSQKRVDLNQVPYYIVLPMFYFVKPLRSGEKKAGFPLWRDEEESH